MPGPGTIRLAGAVAVALLAAGLGCREDIVAPGSCPELCPSAGVRVADTTLTGIVVQDSTYRGYVGAGEMDFLALSNRDSLRSIGLVRLSARASQWNYGTALDDTVSIGSVDSVLLVMNVVQRDTAVHGIRVLFYRLPALFDSTMSFAAAQAYLADSLLVDSLMVPDSVAAGTVSKIVPSGTLDRIPDADTGVVALMMVMRASGPTTLSVASSENYSLAGLRAAWYVTGRAPLDTLTHVFTSGASFDSFVREREPAMTGAGLAAGGVPAARSILRLRLDSLATDSIGVVRATLVLTPTGPVGGRPGETFRLSARGVVRDFGAKSMLFPDTSAGGTVSLTAGDSGTIQIDIARLLRVWGTSVGDSLPKALMLLVEPATTGMGEVSVAGSGAGAAAPRLRLTYVRPYVFGVP